MKKISFQFKNRIKTIIRNKTINKNTFFNFNQQQNKNQLFGNYFSQNIGNFSFNQSIIKRNFAEEVKKKVDDKKASSSSPSVCKVDNPYTQQV